MSGYKAIRVNGKKVDEHRYIMEQYLGRKLSRDEVVHHKNGEKDDNDVDNLEVMDLSEHTKQHHIGSTLSEETKRKISEALIGNQSVNRKLNDSQVEEIKRLHDNGVSNRKIAKMFNVNHQTINDIINGKHYKN